MARDDRIVTQFSDEDIALVNQAKDIVFKVLVKYNPKDKMVAHLRKGHSILTNVVNYHRLQKIKKQQL